MIPVNKEAIEKEKVEGYFDQWEEISHLLYEAFDQRQQNTKELMERGIHLFEALIVQTSQTEEETMNANEQYEVMPINGMERLQFIKSRPDRYASYRQLDELFKELKKKYARLRIQK